MLEALFLTRVLTHYRVPFHERVRALLAGESVSYRLAYGRPTAAESKKGDLVDLDWAEPTPTRYFGASDLVWQSPPRGSPDLIIIGQENKNLSNYAMQLRRIAGLPGPKLAFFGHGKNFQADDPGSRSERFKRFWTDKVDWWFAYTDRSADVVAQTGFPRGRITVFNNSIDTSAIQRELAAIPESEVELARARFGGSPHIGVYVGGLYERKRIPFLLAAAERVRARVPDFQLLVIGGGTEAARVQRAAAEHDWIHALGPKFGRDKAVLLRLGRVFLMPGLVGLGVLDSFAYGAPMVTTAVPYHSPEIDYLKPGENGLLLKDPEDVEAYAAAVAEVLTEEPLRRRLQAGAAAALADYSIERMAERFSDGVLRALAQARA